MPLRSQGRDASQLRLQRRIQSRVPRVGGGRVICCACAHVLAALMRFSIRRCRCDAVTVFRGRTFLHSAIHPLLRMRIIKRQTTTETATASATATATTTTTHQSASIEPSHFSCICISNFFSIFCICNAMRMTPRWLGRGNGKGGKCWGAASAFPRAYISGPKALLLT